MSPSISAVVTAYNAEPFLGETLDAILGQSHPPDEVVVVDDGSTDATADILASYGPALRVTRQPNAGHAAALNRACTVAGGEYLAKCDADDVWEQHKLERQVAALREHPQVDIAFSAVRVFGPSRKAEGLPETGGLDDAEAGTGLIDRGAFIRALYRANMVASTTTLIRRALYERLGPFVSGHSAEDYDFWFRTLRAGAVWYYDPEPLVRQRRHPGQITSAQLPIREATHEVHKLNGDLVGDRGLVRSVFARDTSAMGRIHVDDREWQAARSAFARSLRHRPTGFSAAWLAILGVPQPLRDPLIRTSLAAKRRVDLRLQASRA